MTPSLELVRIETPADANLILGHAHFIKTAEDLYETVIHCATANPVQAVVARDGDQGAVLGVMDGSRPLGVEDDPQARARRDFVRKIGYKLS